MAFTEKYVTVSGGGLHDGSSEANAWTLAEGIANATSGDRVNIKKGTYSQGSTSVDFNVSGTASSPIFWRGYDNTPGDIDADNSLQKPEITFGNAGLTISGSNQILQNVKITGSKSSSALVLCSGGYTKILRCFIENTNASSTASAFRSAPGVSQTTFAINCFFAATSTANSVIQSRRSLLLTGCVINSGVKGLVFDNITTVATTSVTRCIFKAQSTNCIEAQGVSATLYVRENTFYSCGSHAITVLNAAAPTLLYEISNNVFSEIAGDAIRNGTGSVQNYFVAFNNLFHNVSGSFYANQGDDPNFYSLQDSLSPFVDSLSSDFTLASSSNGYSTGLPNAHENQVFSSNQDIGAIQHADPSSSGGGGAVLHPLRSN